MMSYFRLRKCPVCLSDNFRHKWKVPAERYFYDKFGISHANIVQCKKCQIKYTNPILIPNIGNLQYTDSLSGYNIKRYTNSEQIYSEDQLICLREIQELGKKLNLKKVKVLDFGCGRGGMVYLCQKNQINAVGIDINERNILLGKSLGIKNLLKKDLNTMNSNSYDIITAIHILEHLDNCYTAVSEFKRILKPNGYVFVFIPNSGSMKCTINYRLYWHAPYQHMNGFTASSLDILFTQFGFRRMPLKGKYITLSMILTKLFGNIFNLFPTKLFCIYNKRS